MSAVLELQLLREPGAPASTAIALRKAAVELETRLREGRPSPRLGQHDVLRWEVESRADVDQAEATLDSRFSTFVVIPDFLAYLCVRREGSVVVAMQLRRDTLGARVTEHSLGAIAIQLLQVGYDLLPGNADVVPVLRLGPMDGVAPGDPASLQGGMSAQASFPWMSRGVVATRGTDAIPKAALVGAADAVTTELVAQLVAALEPSARRGRVSGFSAH